VLPVGTYVPLYDPANLAAAPHPRLEDHRFRSPDDVIEWARQDFAIPSKTFPEVFHVDVEGAYRCGYRASSLDTIGRWADNPHDLLRSRWEGMAKMCCASNWLIVEHRTLPGHTVPPSEADAEDFVHVRKILATVGVQLIDLVIFDGQFHAWSLHELESPGTPYLLIDDDD
jgi:hypothetical protein